MLLILAAVAAAPTEPNRLARLPEGVDAEANELLPTPADPPPLLPPEASLPETAAQPALPPASTDQPQPLNSPQSLPFGDQPLAPVAEPLAPDSTPTYREHANHPQQPDAVEVFRASFEDDEDEDFDGWPDGWSRKRGAGFPWYLKIGMAEIDTRHGRQALAVQLNGGAAAVYSPPIEVHAEFSYLLHAQVMTKQLEHDRASISVVFFDDDGKVVERFESPLVGGTTTWRQVQLGPLAASSDAVRKAVIGLHVTPGDKADLHGAAYFDGIWLGRLPRMTFDSDRSYNLYTVGEQPALQCRVSGIFDAQPQVVFEVFDIEQRLVQSHTTALTMDTTPQESEFPETAAVAGYRGQANWQPKLPQAGYYLATATLKGHSGTLLKREQTLALVEAGTLSNSGEFGWTMPQGSDPLSLTSLEQLLPQVGVNWVKLPLWADEQDNQRLDRLVTFAERMSHRGIETVGLLTDPPPAAREKFGNLPQLSAADIFSTDPQLWYPLLEPVMARLSLQVRWWQLGTDDDVSFVGYRQLAATLAKIKSELQRFGQEVNLGLAWRIFDEPLTKQTGDGWDYLSLTSQPQPTAAEITTYLRDYKSDSTRCWLSLKPLPADQYSLETRTSDLVHRMLAAKMAGADAIFLNDPFHPQRGLMRPQGTPGELLLPWRTTAQVLSSAEYLGSLELPNSSTNHLFARDGRVTMVVWNHRPLRETFHLGGELTAVDVWGRPTKLDCHEGACQLDVGPMPVFIQGIHPAIVRWNAAVDFRRHALPSVFGITHENALLVKNTFPQGVGVRARFDFADSWKIVPRMLDFKLATGEEAEQSFGIALPYDASSGKHRVRIDFDVQAEQRYQFSVYREINVGNNDILLDATAQLNDKGELEVEQIVTNRENNPVSFKCFLFVPDRRRLMTQVIQLAADQDRKLYRLPNGRELIGKTIWLRAEEMGGNRTLNRQLVVTE